MEERFYWLGFSVFSGIGPVKFKLLLNKFGSAKNAWSAEQTDLNNVLGKVLGLKFDKFRKEFSIENYLRILEQKEVWFLTLTDKEYPQILRETEKPPFVIFGKGNVHLLENEKNFAVVGTRKITQYGKEVTEIFTRELVQNNFTIVSGLALGVDAVSHKTALENIGKTIAVLGCGVDCCTPTENTALYNSIVKNGAVISEIPLSVGPTKGSFPARNRIIAGLSIGVLVTEGAKDSGSLITADYGLKFKRKVFAVPGPITSSLSKGPYELIQKGAKLVTSAEDILKEFKIQNSKVKISSQKLKVKGSTKEERKVLRILENEPLHFDEIARKTKLTSSETAAILTMMEVKGLVKSLDGGMYSL